MENNNQIRVAICGEARSGKDHFAEQLANQFRSEGKTVLKIAFADKIKSLYREFFPADLTHGKPRDAYLKIGNTFREIYPDVWVDALANDLEHLYLWDVIIITDLRFPNEVEFCESNGFTIFKTWADPEVRVKRAKELGEVLVLDNDGDIHVNGIDASFIIDTTYNPEFEDVYKDLKTIGWSV